MPLASRLCLGFRRTCNEKLPFHQQRNVAIPQAGSVAKFGQCCQHSYAPFNKRGVTELPSTKWLLKILSCAQTPHALKSARVVFAKCDRTWSLRKSQRRFIPQKRAGAASQPGMKSDTGDLRARHERGYIGNRTIEPAGRIFAQLAARPASSQ
jgi:hypothetical protein